MQYTDFKHDGIKVSRFGMGTMRLPKIKEEDGTERINEPEAIAMIRKAIDSGVNYIDTAYIYPGSEEVVGKALLDGYREKVLLATKLPVSMIKEQGDLQKFLDTELERLQTDHIDVYFLHNLYASNWKKVLEFNALDFMSDLKKKGIIKYIAVSLHDKYDHFEQVIDYFDWDLAMIQYNYYDRFNQAGEKGLKYAASKGIPVVTMESLHGGMLSTNVPERVQAAFGDWNKDKSDAEKSFMWLYNQPEVTVILSGVSTMEQLEDNLRIFENAQPNVLSVEELELYEEARKAWNSYINVECTGCAYCMPCPMGVDIPTAFQLYNDYAKSQAQGWLYNVMLILSGKDASKCVECGKCEKQCPQQIKIIQMLKEAHSAMAPKQA